MDRGAPDTGAARKDRNAHRLRCRGLPQADGHREVLLNRCLPSTDTATTDPSVRIWFSVAGTSAERPIYPNDLEIQGGRESYPEQIGQRSQMAKVEYSPTPSMRAAIESQRNGTSTSAQSGRFNAKKSGLQSICRTILLAKSERIRIRPASSGALVHAETPDHAAKPNMTVQAGPNIQFGGFQDGLRRSSYQGPTVVVHPPTASTRITVAAAITIGVWCPI